MTERFTDFVVTRIVPESEIICSFYLAPQTPLPRDFVPGEYLLFEHTEPDAKPVRREYSISGQCSDGLRVTIKHETAPNAAVPDGVMSSRFHTALKPGDVLRAAGPMGKFTLDRESTRPAVLLSGGVGLTPLVAMAHDLAAEGTRQTLFIHACENGRVHAMGREMRDLATKHPNFSTHFVYRSPESGDRLKTDYDSTGIVEKPLLDELLPGLDCDFYLCGPAPFMQAMYDLLHEMGVQTDRISYEFFGPASVLRPRNGAAPEPGTKAGDTAQPTVTFARTGIEASWDPDIENLLEFAEDNGVMVDFSCRAGSCDTCKTKVLSGDVSYPQTPFELPAKGYALLCCCVPNGNLELDV